MKRRITTLALWPWKWVCLWLLSATAAWAQIPGELDRGFDPGLGANGTVWATATQPDGKYLVVGNFKQFNGTRANRIVRLWPSGAIDASFNSSAGADSTIYSLALQPDGKIIVGGMFFKLDGRASRSIGRLMPDGALDTTFRAGRGANSDVHSVVLQPDGRILVGGRFDSLAGKGRRRIGRLNPNGTLDETFNPGRALDWFVYTVALQGSGHALIGGNFNTYNWVPRGRFARIRPTGALDTSFAMGTGASSFGAPNIQTIALQPNGGILMGGMFFMFNQFVRPMLVRLDANGNLDQSFGQSGGPNDEVHHLTTQPDGSILVAGKFTAVDTLRYRHLARLLPTGVVDTVFKSGTGPNASVRHVQVLSDGGLLIAGEFTDYNGTARNRIARLYGGSCLVPTPLISLAGQHTLCGADSLRLRASGGLRYRWNTGDTTSSITIRQPGTYYVRTIAATCTSAQSASLQVTVQPVPATPSIQFHGANQDSLQCSLVADAYRWYRNGTWLPSEQSRQIRIAQWGTYAVQTVVSGCLSATSAPLTSLATMHHTHWQARHNPLEQELVITAPDLHLAQPYQLLNSAGQVIRQGLLQPGTTTISTVSLASGLYYLKSGRVIKVWW